MPKCRAVEVITEKLWITYDQHGNKTGIIKPSAEDTGQMVQFLVDGTKVAHNRDEIDQLFEFEQRQDSHSYDEKNVFGYPVIDVETFNIQEKNNLPCFTKTPGSKVFFAAGYYAINFDNGGWMESFCPKLSTLNKYEHMGPFRIQSDSQLAIKRKQRSQ